jgi:hypothetical protein
VPLNSDEAKSLGSAAWLHRVSDKKTAMNNARFMMDLLNNYFPNPAKNIIPGDMSEFNKYFSFTPIQG